MFGFLGPNGAGKSTTIRMLMGMARPSAGDAWLAGFPAVADVEQAHRPRGPRCRPRWPCGRNLTGTETLELLAHLGPQPDLDYRDRLVDQFDLRARPNGPGPIRRGTGRRWPWSQRSRPWHRY